ncbi:bacterio-opsin activator domain-containing protein [Salarchaeum japonicum]|uniref:Response regulator n=1 Tax=Salarchaeum japonicum TaxID=555573 RepID=A0AAV3SYA0_9EURY|nr:bacterio-opsin activator domain-containing protein [Salarchaeum japonicum]
MSDGLRVLVVDDDEAFLSVTVEFLERRGVDVVAETSASAALDRLGEGFSCVVSDYEMPAMDGLELLKAVRAERPELPFVLLTGAGSEDVASEAISLGATEYVQKRPGRGQFDILVNTVVNAAEAYETERELAASRAFVEDAVEAVRDVFFVADVSGEVTHWNSRAEDVMGGRDPSEVEPESVVASDDREAVAAAFEAAVAEGSARVDAAVGEDAVPFEFTFSRITDDDGRVTHVAGVGRDVSERVARERAVTTLHETTRALVTAETPEDVFEYAVGAADGLLGLARTAFYRWDADERALVAAATANGTPGELPVLGDGSAVWDAFVAEETRTVESAAVFGELAALVVSVGSHGVLVAGSESGGFDDVDVTVVEVLAANTAAALDRHDREAALREQERELAAKTERLEEVNRTNTLVRRTQAGLLGASSREDVERSVCESLAADDEYVFAWTGTLDDGEVSPRAWAGAGESILDALAVEDATASPAWRAVERDEPVVVSDLVSAAGGGWRRRALAAGAGSAAAFPLSFDGGSYGVLVVYGRRANQFGREEREILSELAATVASAVNAAERKEALVTGGDVEVTFRVPDATGPVSAMARRTGATFDLEEVVSKDDGSWLVYVAVADADPAAVSAAADALVSVESVDVFDSDADRSLVGLVVSEFPAVDVLAAHGASVQSLTATPREVEVSVTVPRTRSVREFVAACEERLPGIELVRRSQRASQPAVLVEGLTEKQRTALRTAYEHGFFSWPREHTGEEVAEAMGVSAPTFHQHLRKALGTVFAAAFGDHADLND